MLFLLILLLLLTLLLLLLMVFIFPVLSLRVSCCVSLAYSALLYLSVLLRGCSFSPSLSSSPSEYRAECGVCSDTEMCSRKLCSGTVPFKNTSSPVLSVPLVCPRGLSCAVCVCVCICVCCCVLFSRSARIRCCCSLQSLRPSVRKWKGAGTVAGRSGSNRRCTEPRAVLSNTSIPISSVSDDALRDKRNIFDADCCEVDVGGDEVLW